jgi:hypothetical protein
MVQLNVTQLTKFFDQQQQTFKIQLGGRVLHEQIDTFAQHSNNPGQYFTIQLTGVPVCIVKS